MHEQVHMNNNIKVIRKFIEISVDEKVIWIRLEIRERKSGKLMAETNPIYFNHI